MNIIDRTRYTFCRRDCLVSCCFQVKKKKHSTITTNNIKDEHFSIPVSSSSQTKSFVSSTKNLRMLRILGFKDIQKDYGPLQHQLSHYVCNQNQVKQAQNLRYSTIYSPAQCDSAYQLFLGADYYPLVQTGYVQEDKHHNSDAIDQSSTFPKIKSQPYFDASFNSS